MKSESNIMPNSFSIEKLGKNALVIIYENIETHTRVNVETNEEETYYTYDEYSLIVPYRSNLVNIIEESLSDWVQYIKDNQPKPFYTPMQIVEQGITDLQIENIEQGQQITDLELEVLSNV